MSTTELRALYDNLERDRWRDQHPLSDEVKVASDVLYHPYATDGERFRAINPWMQRHQPCLFGRVAAAANAIHYCFLTDEDINRCDDDQIRAKIHASLSAWKHRSLRPHEGLSAPAHGFALVVASQKVALARPDSHLRRFAERVRDLWGCPAEHTTAGRVNTEALYLENPADSTLVRFTINVDFFAAQGDGRWWHDHRAPGGIVFTANSAGHMRRYREWYAGKSDQIEWILKTAMATIDAAAETEFGRATWLRPLIDGRPFVREITCPFREPTALKDTLKDKDWTRYGGHLHTDHSIRSEFFDERPEKSLDVQSREYLQDFAYIFDARSADHLRFMGGQAVSREEVDREIGSPADLVQLSMPPRLRAADDPRVRRTLDALLRECASWSLSDAERSALDL